LNLSIWKSKELSVHQGWSAARPTALRVFGLRNYLICTSDIDRDSEVEEYSPEISVAKHRTEQKYALKSKEEIMFAQRPIKGRCNRNHKQI